LVRRSIGGAERVAFRLGVTDSDTLAAEFRIEGTVQTPLHELKPFTAHVHAPETMLLNHPIQEENFPTVSRAIIQIRAKPRASYARRRDHVQAALSRFLKRD
jgi:hypothetical protein